ncbi:MAG: porin family protein [Proteobacteria bacterium]|nr:porin family protein [Pseudomonadota bacterium]
MELKNSIHRLAMHPGYRTTLFFPERVVHLALGNKTAYLLTIDNQWRRFDLQPKPGAPATNINFETASAKLTFDLAPLQEIGDQCITRLVIVLPPGVEAEELPKSDLCPEQFGSPELALLRVKLSEVDVHPPVTASFESNAHKLELQTGYWTISRVAAAFAFEITNGGEHAYPTTGLAMGDGATNQDYLLAWLLDTKAGKMPKALAPGETLRGAIVASHPAHLRKGFVLQLLSNPGVVSAAFKWNEEKEESPNEGRASIQAQAVTGFINIQNAANNPTDSDYTTLWGIGGRALYGFSKALSLEGTILVSFTDQAVFEDSSTAEATAGRALLGGVFHIGEKTVPYLRAGIGFRLGRYMMSASKDEWRSSGLFCVGGGVDAWLGDGFSLGVSAQYVGGEEDSFEVGAHLGFGWKP